MSKFLTALKAIVPEPTKNLWNDSSFFEKILVVFLQLITFALPFMIVMIFTNTYVIEILITLIVGSVLAQILNLSRYLRRRYGSRGIL